MCKYNSEDMARGVLAARFAKANTTSVSGAMVMDAKKLKMISQRQIDKLGITTRLRRKGEDFNHQMGLEIAAVIASNMARRAAAAAPKAQAA
ncbi:MAG TPA: hypothetical protein VIN59_03470 [Alphaproteobacteria bacterium]